MLYVERHSSVLCNTGSACVGFKGYSESACNHAYLGSGQINYAAASEQWHGFFQVAL